MDNHSKFQPAPHDKQTILSQMSSDDDLVCICADCQKIRNDNGVWQRIDIDSHWSLTHSFCPDCLKKRYMELEEFIKINETEIVR